MNLGTDEQGSTTAEFAVVLPAVLLVVVMVIGGILLATTRVTLVSAAHDIARLEARNDSGLVAERVAQLPSRATIARADTGGVLCVTLRSSPGAGPLSRVVIEGRGCAVRAGDS